YDVSIFFFSSRRRHTRWPRDWSSDVCSSDLCRSLAGTIAWREIGSIVARHWLPYAVLATLLLVISMLRGDRALPGRAAAVGLGEIGRASCRERVEMPVGDVL